METITTEIDWPPPHTVRHSKRAKYVQLKISGETGLEVVVPAGIKFVDTAALFAQHRDWIEQKLGLLLEQPKTQSVNELPSTLSLAAIDEVWTIEYMTAFLPDQLKTKRKKYLFHSWKMHNREPSHTATSIC